MAGLPSDSCSRAPEVSWPSFRLVTDWFLVTPPVSTRSLARRIETPVIQWSSVKGQGHSMAQET